MTAIPVPHAYRPSRDGVLIAVAGLAGGLFLWFFGLTSTSPFPLSESVPRWLVLVPLGMMCLATLGRRTAHPYALVLGVLAQIGDVLLGSLLATVILFTDVVYAAVLYGSARLARVLARGAVIFTVVVSVTLIAIFRRPEVLLLIAVCGGVTVAPAWTAVLLRHHRDEAAAERLRAEQTALLAEMDRTQAINAERSRMARELHDVVANHLSAIAIHSTAALSLGDAGEGRDRDSTADTTREALGVIRENSVRGLAEMRRLIGLLRDADGEAEPMATPSLSGLDALLARARATAGDGRTFTLDDRREPGERLPAPVELAAYRVVQEAVTNALKHGSSGPVTVELAHQDDLRIRVTSPLTGDDSPRAPGAGAGLVGMRERVDLLHGQLSAGPVTAPDGTKIWEVRAALPALREATGAVDHKEKNR